MTFKLNDKVICIEPWPKILKKGEVYKVTETLVEFNTCFIKLNHQNTWWNEKRFIHNVELSEQ